MRTPEGAEKDAIKKYLVGIGAWFFCPYMAGFGKSGVPDIVGCYRGRWFSIEVKREGKEPTKLQEKRMGEIRAAGGIALQGWATKVINELTLIRFDIDISVGRELIAVGEALPPPSRSTREGRTPRSERGSPQGRR